eukprot:356701-Chlamydomonas_euryale.AAC.13
MFWQMPSLAPVSSTASVSPIFATEMRAPVMTTMLHKSACDCLTDVSSIALHLCGNIAGKPFMCAAAIPSGKLPEGLAEIQHPLPGAQATRESPLASSGSGVHEGSLAFNILAA